MLHALWWIKWIVIFFPASRYIKIVYLCYFREHDGIIITLTTQPTCVAFNCLIARILMSNLLNLGVASLRSSYCLLKINVSNNEINPNNVILFKKESQCKQSFIQSVLFLKSKFSSVFNVLKTTVTLTSCHVFFLFLHLPKQLFQ